MALTSHVVLVLERSCYGWGHIMRISDSIFVNKSRYGVMGSLRCPMTGPAPPNELAGVSELGLGLRNGLDPIEVFPKAQFS